LGRVVEKREHQAPGGVEACGEVLGVHEDERVVIGGGEKILVGEPEHAEIVVQGGVLVVRAELLYALEGGSHAALAGGGVGVPTAEREGEDGVRTITYGVGGEDAAFLGRMEERSLRLASYVLFAA
jgi:hypothetical protein